MKTKIIKDLVYVVFLVLSVSILSFAEDVVKLGKIDKEKIFRVDEKLAAKENLDFFTVNPDSIKVELKKVKYGEDLEFFNGNEKVNVKGTEETIVTIDRIINIAMKLWKIVVDNQPVSNIENKYAVAYPQGITSASQLSNWEKPKVYVYGFYANNLYGLRVIDVEYEVIFNYGGDYKGKGKFLTGVSIVPTKVDVAWGYRFNMHSYVPDSTVVNVGTTKDPIAALQLKLTWKISTYVKDFTATSVYYIQGDGYFSEIASPFKSEKGVEDSFIAPLMDSRNIEKVFDEAVKK